MKKAIIFHLLTKFHEIDYIGESTYLKYKNYKSLSEDPENYNRCIHRERFLEIEYCEKNNIEYFFIIALSTDEKTQWGFLQRKVEILDKNFKRVETLQGYEIFLRSYIGDMEYDTELIQKLGGKITGMFDYKNWFDYIDKKYLGRKMGKSTLENINKDIQDYSGESIFVKTIKKGVGKAARKTHILTDIFSYKIFDYDDNEELLISEVIKIKKEYRCFVINGTLTSASVYLDYTVEEIPVKIIETANAFIEDHKNIFGENATYVVDFCETEEGDVKLIEMNDLRASGRYKGNGVKEMIETFLK